MAAPGAEVAFEPKMGGHFVRTVHLKLVKQENVIFLFGKIYELIARRSVIMNAWQFKNSFNVSKIARRIQPKTTLNTL